MFEAYKVDGELNVAAFFDIATPSQVSGTPPPPALTPRHPGDAQRESGLKNAGI